MQVHWINGVVMVLFGTGAGGWSLGCKPGDNSNVVTIFYASSLSGVLSTVEENLERQNPEMDLRLEPSGSQVAARKVAELGQKGDLVFTADYQVIDDILMGNFADFNLLFATNELVLAHCEHSRFTEEITTQNWPAVLLRPDVRLARVDENLAPIGYQTLMAWKLAEQHYGVAATGPDFSGRLKALCRPEHVAPDAVELVTLLESRVVDYVFVFRSIAEEHNLKITPLPPECNLSRPELASTYAKVSVEVKMNAREAPRTIAGGPIFFGVTIPKVAPNPKGAEGVLAYLFGSEGQRILKRFGFQPKSPVVCRQMERVPKELRNFIVQGEMP